MKRREVLSLIRAGVVAAAAWPLLRATNARAGTSTRPRFYLQVIPQGGMDSVYTTDPKKVAEVDPGIDVPFGPKDIVETSGTRLGPSFRALARWMPRLAIVNAFHQNSANHMSGLAHVMRCKSNTTPGTPSLLEILGSRRQGEATGAINIGAVMTSGFSPDYLGEPGEYAFGSRPGVFEHLDNADPDDLVELAKALRREAAPLTGARASSAEKVTAENLLSSAELFARVAVVPKFVAADWKHPADGYFHNGRDFDRAIWMFENGLTRCATICVGSQAFDTHVWNTTNQPRITEYLGFLLDNLFDRLDKKIFEGRPLAEQTVVIVGSEIGRFPRLNSSHGKDHFPQAPHLFFGPGIATGKTYGASGRNMATMPISLTTGRPETGGHVLRVDDIGRTLLDIDGADPDIYGYTGDHLTFLTG